MNSFIVSSAPTKTSFFMSDKEVAARIGIGKSTVWKWAASNPNIPKPHKLSNKCSRWVRSEIESYLAVLSGKGRSEVFSGSEE